MAALRIEDLTFDVPVHTVVLVQIDQRLYGLAQYVRNLRLTETAATAAQSLHQIGDRAAGAELPAPVTRMSTIRSVGVHFSRPTRNEPAAKKTENHIRNQFLWYTEVGGCTTATAVIVCVFPCSMCRNY